MPKMLTQASSLSKSTLFVLPFLTVNVEMGVKDIEMGSLCGKVYNEII